MASTRFLALQREGSSETAQTAADYGTGGSGANATWYKIRVTGIGDPVSRNAAFEEAIDISVATAAVGGAYKVSGTIDATLRFASFSRLFEAMLGFASSDGNYYLGDTPVSYSFLIGDDQAGRQTQYKGCGISSMEFNLSVGQFITTKISWIGKNAVEITPGQEVEPAWLVAPTADAPAIWYNAIVKVDNTPITAKSITLRLDRKFDQDYHFIGSPLLQGLYMNGQTEASGTITLGSGEWSELKAVLVGSTSDAVHSITAPATGVTQTLGTESKNELYTGAFSIDLHDKDGVKVGAIVAGDVVFNESNRSVQGRNQWEKSINYRVIVPTATSFYINPGAS
jgi:hypothetical protein